MKTAFWPYDVFGYLLPGLLVTTGLSFSNSAVHNWISKQFDFEHAADFAVAVGLSYLAGHVVAALSSRLLERKVLRQTWGYPTANLFPTADGGAPKKTGFIQNLLDPGYSRAYSVGFSALFQERFQAVFPGMSNEIDEHDRYWLCWQYVSMTHPAGYHRATHFLELYGFSRNTSMSFLLLLPAPLFPAWASPMPIWLWLLSGVISCLVFLGNYMKLFRRMNDEVYRGFVVAAERQAEL